MDFPPFPRLGSLGPLSYLSLYMQWQILAYYCKLLLYNRCIGLSLTVVGFSLAIVGLKPQPYYCIGLSLSQPYSVSALLLYIGLSLTLVGFSELQI